MKIEKDFIRKNKKIEIISNGGKASKIPQEWRPVLTNCDILVTIPDMHMYIYNTPLDNFKFGAKAMLKFLDYLDTLKEEMALQGKTLRIYQLGDLYEQRFPGMSDEGKNATATEIRMSHPQYDQIINTMNGMRTHFIYGNHDFELRHFPGYRCAAIEGKVYMEHGFTADSWEDFANPYAPLWEAGQLAFKTIREINMFFANLLVTLGVIEKDAFCSIGITSGKRANYKYPSNNKYEEEYKDKYLKHFIDRLKADPDNCGVKICVIGHTHHPYLNTDIDNGNYIYIDAGAWTVGRSDFAVITNEEVAICCYRRS